jgi:hypothetical protein
MEIVKFDKANLTLMRNLIDGALQKVTEETGVKFTMGNITYDRSGFNFSSKLEAKIDNEASKAEEIRKANDILSMYKLNVGQQFRWGKHDMEITGYDFKRNKNPLKVKSLTDNRNYILDPVAVNTHLKL